MKQAREGPHRGELTEEVVEPGAGRRDAVDVGRTDDRVPVGTNAVATVLVGHVDDDIRWPVVGLAAHGCLTLQYSRTRCGNGRGFHERPSPHPGRALVLHFCASFACPQPGRTPATARACAPAFCRLPVPRPRQLTTRTSRFLSWPGHDAPLVRLPLAQCIWSLCYSKVEVITGTLLIARSQQHHLAAVVAVVAQEDAQGRLDA